MKKFEEFGCQFKNESECEEELEDEGLNMGDVDKDFFGDE